MSADSDRRLIADIAMVLESVSRGNTSAAAALEQVTDFMVADGWTQFAPTFGGYSPGRSLRLTEFKPESEWPQRPDSGEREDCDICYATEDDDGEINHGKGCYVVSENGGGTTYTDRARGRRS